MLNVELERLPAKRIFLPYICDPPGEDPHIVGDRSRFLPYLLLHVRQNRRAQRQHPGIVGDLLDEFSDLLEFFAESMIRGACGVGLVYHDEPASLVIVFVQEIFADTTVRRLASDKVESSGASGKFVDKDGRASACMSPHLLVSRHSRRDN